jgi:four helix bundle protein
MPDTKRLQHFRDLDVYCRSFDAAMKIFEITKTFPSEERYSLTDQVRRSSRSVCANLAEAWRKRKYPAVFRNKLTDSMQEASETQSWLEFSLACKYMDNNSFHQLDQEYEGILAMLNAMEKAHDKFCF